MRVIPLSVTTRTQTTSRPTRTQLSRIRSAFITNRMSRHFIYDENDNELIDGDAWESGDFDDPGAHITLEVNGNCCQFYQNTGRHMLNLLYYVVDFYDQGGLVSGWMDDGNYSFYQEQMDNTFVEGYQFVGHGPRIILQEDGIIFLGSTEQWTIACGELDGQLTYTNVTNDVNSNQSNFSNGQGIQTAMVVLNAPSHTVCGSERTSFNDIVTSGMRF